MFSEKNINGMLAVFFILLILGFLVHRDRIFPSSLPGHIIGIAGTTFIFMALLYPFRKRVMGIRGKRNPLNRHITYGLTGASLVVIHSAHKISSLIGLLIFLSLLLLILSGIIGRFLFRKVNKGLKEQKSNLDLIKKRLQEKGDEILSCDFSFSTASVTEEKEAGIEDPTELEKMSRMCGQWRDEIYAVAELEYSIRMFDKTKSLFSRWIKAHYFFTSFLLAMLVVHVLTTLYYGIKWLW
jgi:hypothetical protein